MEVYQNFPVRRVFTVENNLLTKRIHYNYFNVQQVLGNISGL